MIEKRTDFKERVTVEFINYDTEIILKKYSYFFSYPKSYPLKSPMPNGFSVSVWGACLKDRLETFLILDAVFA